MTRDSGDPRFAVPLYTIAEAARFLRVPRTTLATWAHGYERARPSRKLISSDAIVTSIPAAKGEPQIPFGGLAEAMVLAAMRRAGVSLQHIRAAVAVLSGELGIEHALASKRLYTDGAQLLYDYAEREREEELENLTIVVSGQRVFGGVVKDYLERIAYANDGWANRVVLPMTDRAIVEADPARSFGQPIFVEGAARLEDVVDRWKAGEPLAEVAADFGVPVADIEDVLRATLPVAA
ncbi:MAG: DUF433 domain-containing protein [Acidimicrobiia bacterium]